jgi:hypothetical protein
MMGSPEIYEMAVEAVLREQLRLQVANSLYPEYLRNLEPLREAVVLCACGQFDAYVVARGYSTRADVLVAALDLEHFVCMRMAARWN